MDGAFFEEYSSLDNIHDDHVNKAQQETLKHESHHYIGPDPYHTTVFKPPPKEKVSWIYLLIWKGNQLAGFCIFAILAFNELIRGV